MLSVLKSQKGPFYAIYLSTFLFALHVALPLYINSSFLGQFFAETTIGFVYVAASVVALVALAYYPKILRSIGNYKTTLFLLVLEAILLIVLAYSSSLYFAIPAFIGMQVLLTLGLFNLDIFLENFSDDNVTGTLRGIMLTVINIAILLGPLMAGIIIANGDFWKVYLIAAILLIPIIYIVVKQFHDFRDPEYDHSPLFQKVKEVLFASHPNDGIRHVIISNFIMRFFFSWMVLYTPIYLNKYIGFTWSEIGIILTLMLLPFVLFEVPVGKWIDKSTSEKKVMALGFVIISLFTASLFFAGDASIFVWAALLFGSRIGASFVEITTESYFFKHINSSDTNILSIFRDTRPIAYILGPLSASLLLLIFPIHYLFLILGAVMLLGVWNSLVMGQE